MGRMKTGRMESTSRVVFNEFGLSSFLKLPKAVQKQALKKIYEVVGASPESAGYPLKRELSGFRGIHTNRYRIVWRALTLASGEVIADISYVGIRKEGNKRQDIYAEAQKMLTWLRWP